jgi:hypothetical protein
VQKERAMHGTTRPKPTTHRAGTGTNAVVWIEPGRALLVRGGDDGYATVELSVPHIPTATTPALAEIAHRLGDVDRVLVLGTDDLRIALEREIVAIGHRPETIREAIVEGPVDEAILVARLRRLA